MQRRGREDDIMRRGRKETVKKRVRLGKAGGGVVGVKGGGEV